MNITLVLYFALINEFTVHINRMVEGVLEREEGLSHFS